jgi:3-methyl-2-oxobutanoate hydroxymethyltransferase
VEIAVAFIKAGAEAVKIEGGRKRAALVRRFTENEIPVLGHIGLTPQSVHALGGYKVQGKTAVEAEALLEDALALERAGAFAVVLEGIPAELASRITAQVAIPTIGIGAGPDCDGQILVLTDVLGLTLPTPEAAEKAEASALKPRFVRQYLDLRSLIAGALARYGEDVRSGDFPSEQESYHSGSRQSAVTDGAGLNQPHRRSSGVS